MASVEEEYCFLSQIASARIELRDRFSLAHRLLQEREEALLTQLQEMEVTYRDRRVRQAQQRKELLATKEQLNSLKANENQTTVEEMLTPLNAKLRELEISGNLIHKIELNWSRERELIDLLGVIGTIKLITSNKEYTLKKLPVLVACKFRPNTLKPGEFKCPTAVAINPKTNNIYIGDESNDRIQVFNQSCEFLFSFSEKMSSPAGVCFHRDEVYVTQFASNSINVYTANGDYKKSLGSEGEDRLEFRGPFGACVSEQKSRVYICERTNNRVQVLNTDLSFNSFIIGLFQPKYVKVTKEEIFVLDRNNPCIHVYNYEHDTVRSIISYGGQGCQVSRSAQFNVDNFSNILISDYSSCCVLIFSRDGDIVHRFGEKGTNHGELTNPTGIAIDSEGRIIVASRNPNYCIQFF